LAPPTIPFVSVNVWRMRARSALSEIRRHAPRRNPDGAAIEFRQDNGELRAVAQNHRPLDDKSRSGAWKTPLLRFLKSVGANMVGDAQAALSELVNRAPEE
jgi:hypothetical protein